MIAKAPTASRLVMLKFMRSERSGCPQRDHRVNCRSPQDRQPYAILAANRTRDVDHSKGAWRT
jgi:hypothetical protein